MNFSRRDMLKGAAATLLTGASSLAIGPALAASRGRAADAKSPVTGVAELSRSLFAGAVGSDFHVHVGAVQTATLQLESITDLVTPTGRMEDLKVPRDREGQFHSQVFERYSRYEPEVAEALTQMFVSGVSTHKVGEVAATLTGVAPSASAVSRLNHTLTEQYEVWRDRRLLPHYRIIYLDGIHFTVRHGTQTDATMILTALGVDLAGQREVLALRACAEEDKDGWSCLLQDLRTRGVTEIDLIVTDGHDGLLAAVSALFSATPRQRCLVHKQRNVMNAIPKREQQEVATELTGIWKQEKKEDALLNLAAFKAKYRQRYPEAIRSLCEDEEHLLTFYAFPSVMHRYIRSTNAIESLFSNVRQRTDQIDAFTTETSCLTIVWAVMQDIHLPRIPVG